MSRREAWRTPLLVGFPLLGLALLSGCSAADDTPSGENVAGTPNTSGAPNAGFAGGGRAGAAGSAGAFGGSGGGSAGSASGSAGATGNSGSAGSTAGAGSAGQSAAGGSAGEQPSSGGAGSGSLPSGGQANAAGSNAAGGGGTSAGSAGTGGVANAGGVAGTQATGGGGACDESPPPEEVAAWIDESLDAQLGPNLRNRRAWLLDSAVMGGGEITLCVRWGATTAVSSDLATNLAETVERWFNDWFTALGSYGCFPYPDGVTTRVTGWAVRPGQQALLANVDPSIPVYTETDPEGEPKCPDECSYFVNPEHEFPDCEGGAENHSDYWLWFDDMLPGGGAAAVGGDWGLRMPIGTFTSNFQRESFGIVEHEMGHGFGFQDYYDWTGSEPEGGSLMIVGSSSSQKPTLGDQWLLRRAWLETKSLRDW